jgi:hypothetical protein
MSVGNRTSIDQCDRRSFSSAPLIDGNGVEEVGVEEDDGNDDVCIDDDRVSS